MGHESGLGARVTSILHAPYVDVDFQDQPAAGKNRTDKQKKIGMVTGTFFLVLSSAGGEQTIFDRGCAIECCVRTHFKLS